MTDPLADAVADVAIETGWTLHEVLALTPGQLALMERALARKYERYAALLGLDVRKPPVINEELERAVERLKQETGRESFGLLEVLNGRSRNATG